MPSQLTLQAGDGMEVPWHQDGHYWPIRPLATCTAWVALDDSTVENGCLRVIAGSHREQSLLEHERDNREGLVLNRKVLDAELDETGAGQVSPFVTCPRRRTSIATSMHPAKAAAT